MKTLIKGATLLDGTGSPAFQADLLIEENRVSQIGNQLHPDGAQIVEAQGGFLAPGFIDVHSHSDFSLLVNPRGEGKVLQGVTLEVVGNCGQSAFPLTGECRKHLQSNWTRFGLQLNWATLAEYREKAHEKGISVNVAPLIGHGNVRASVMGYEDKNPTAAEVRAMERLTGEAMAQGAYGVSTGLLYLPGTFSNRAELVGVMRETGKAGGVYATHLRSEGDRLLEAVEEAIQIAEKSGASLQISHLKTWGRENWGKMDDVLKLIRQAQQSGVRVHCDRYPYTAAYTDLDALLPAWVYDGGREKELLRLQNPRIRRKIAKGLYKKSKREKDFWSSIAVSSVATPPNKRWEGMTIEKMAKLTRVPPIEAVLDLLVEEGLDVGAIFFSMCEENLKRILEQPYCMVGSDASARPLRGPLADGKFHPRTYGTFPRYFANFARSGILSWEEAVRRVTGLAAQKFGLEGRGRLAPGYFADLVLFDPAQIQDAATFENPQQPPVGIKKVWVNGVLVVENGAHTGALPGRVLSKI